MQTRPSQFCSHFYDSCVLCWIERKINFSIFICWVIVDFAHNSQMFLTKFFKSGQIYMKDAQWAETNEKQIFQFLVFWGMVVFVLKIRSFLCTKSTITQTLKIGELIFYSFQLIAHLSCKFDHFWRFFFVKNLMVIKVKTLENCEQ